MLKNKKGYSIIEMILAITLFSLIIVLVTPIISDTNRKAIDFSKKTKSLEIIKNYSDKITYVRNSWQESAENQTENENIHSWWEGEVISKDGLSFSKLEWFYKIEYNDCPNWLQICLSPSESGDGQDYMIDLWIVEQEYSLTASPTFRNEVSYDGLNNVYTVFWKEIDKELCNRAKSCFKTTLKISNIGVDPSNPSKTFYRKELYKKDPLNPSSLENNIWIENPAKNIVITTSYYLEDGREVKESSSLILTAYKSIPSY